MSLSPTVPVANTRPKATAQRLLRNATEDAETNEFLHINPIMVAIGMAITFCLLWYLTIFILYQLARVALPSTI